jgi:hypothetical protein
MAMTCALSATDAHVKQVRMPSDADWPRPWDLVGIKEAAAELHMDRATLGMRRRRAIDFPDPVTVIGSLAVYDLQEIKTWNAEYEANRTRRYSEAAKRRENL